jgi:hypothetical protein
LITEWEGTGGEREKRRVERDKDELEERREVGEELNKER